MSKKNKETRKLAGPIALGMYSGIDGKLFKIDDTKAAKVLKNGRAEFPLREIEENP